MGELEGIDFEAFFDSENFTHQETIVGNYLKMRATKTTRMRDMQFIAPAKYGKNHTNTSFFFKSKIRTSLSLKLFDHRTILNLKFG